MIDLPAYDSLFIISRITNGRDGPLGRPFGSARPAVAPYQIARIHS